VYNENTRLHQRVQEKEVTIHDQMARKTTKTQSIPPSPKRKLQKMNKVDLDASQEKNPEDRAAARARQLDEVNRKLDQTRDMFHALFHANPIPTALTRLEDGALLNVNDEFLTYFGLRRKDVIGRSAAELNIGLDAQERAHLIKRARNEGTIRVYETETLHSSGEKRNIIMSLQFVNIDNMDALISVFVDITERVHAEKQIRELASELTAAEQAERHRIAQVLHDDLQQRIFAILMQLGFLKDAYEKNDLHAFAVDFPQLEMWLAEAIQVTRQLSVDLSPPVLQGESLAEAILWLTSQMQDQYGLEVNIKSDGKPGRLDKKVQVLVFYAVRELLFNIVKHSGTLKATVNFEHDDHHLRVTVMDQGKGFDCIKILNNPKLSHGLLIIRHRLNLLGCKLEVNSQTGKGTEAIIEAPYETMDS
jgi:PAS domain S-box-containing protein